jgi:hypothetical protein
MRNTRSILPDENNREGEKVNSIEAGELNFGSKT